MSCRVTHLGGGGSHRWLGGAIVGVLLTGVVLLPSLLPLGAYTVDLRAILQPPGPFHLLGTDENGRDVLARLLLGGRMTLGIALAATGVALLMGTTVGAIAGYHGGLIDTMLMRLVDATLAFPSLFAILLVAAVFAPGPLLLIGLIGGTNWMLAARLVRGQVKALLAAPYVEAARALGASDLTVISRHLVPNVYSIVFVAGLTQLSRAILAEATISFLGFGIQPPVPTWGNLLIGAQNYVYTAPWLALAPGLAVTGTLLAISTLGIGGRVRPFRGEDRSAPLARARVGVPSQTAPIPSAHGSGSRPSLGLQ